ncbi:hypothetical protein NSA23_09350 [Anaerosalibacter massiliensis]|uniref:Uncharacterized protein n=1 Tax=Anaerosalibacter massiliensis TaxID=1347392 RepID=A0A9X2S5H5_9FIRM|nr:hypothetical protein [Anaerosalibacter massiliensis]MCR2044324.1 hypothetical protein [Anaerosalibacter massiliensis]
MEDIIGKIINIDNETVKVKEKIEAIKRENTKEIEKSSRKMEEEIIGEAKSRGKNIYEEILKNAKEETDKIEENEMAIYKQIERIYEEKRDLIIDRLFNQIFMS